MGAQGTASLNFGSFPGESDTTVAITGQSGILSNSLVEAWIFPSATSDHSADEHIVDPPRIMAGNVVAGVGFTIYGVDQNKLSDPQGRSPKVYGSWNVAWVWS